jgi:uncharacterized protein
VQSPCVLICQIDDVTQLCFGCGRTRAEIAGWISMTEQARAAIMGALPARMETIVKRPRRVTRRQLMAEARLSSNEEVLP